MKQESCKIILDKGTKTVKCNTYKNKVLERIIAIHENPVNKNKTNITDFATGYKFLTIDSPVSSVKESLVEEKLETFLKHFGVKETLDRIAYLEESKEK